MQDLEDHCCGGDGHHVFICLNHLLNAAELSVRMGDSDDASYHWNILEASWIININYGPTMKNKCSQGAVKVQSRYSQTALESNKCTNTSIRRNMINMHEHHQPIIHSPVNIETKFCECVCGFLSSRQTGFVWKKGTVTKKQITHISLYPFIYSIKSHSIPLYPIINISMSRVAPHTPDTRANKW